MGTNDKTSQISNEQLYQTLKDLHRAIVGNPLNPEKEPGMLKIQLDMCRVIYGDDEDGVGGLKKEVEKHTRLIWVGGGILTGVNLCLLAYNFYRQVVPQGP